MGIRKESVSKAFSGNKSYLTNTFILKFNNAFDNMFNNDWLMEGKGEMLIHWRYQKLKCTWG